MVEQLGLAMIPSFQATSCGLTSGTTSGTFGSIRKALELSTTTAPAAAAIGLHSRDTVPGVLDRTISTPRNAPRAIASIGKVSPRKVTVLPALRSEARNLIDATGKARSSSRRIIRSPTAPLAPTTATFFTIELPWLYETRSPRFRGKMLAEYVTISYGPTVGEATRSGRRRHSRLFAAANPF